MAEVYTEPTPSAFGPRPTDPGTPVPLDGDGTTTLDGIAAAFSRENYVAGAASAASAQRDIVDMRFYRVIYDAFDEIEAAMKGMLSP